MIDTPFTPSRHRGFPMRRMIFVTGLGAVAALVSIAAAPAPAPSTMTGIYTIAQAEDGKALYDGACAMCHGPGLHGSFEVPPLTGMFVARWSNASVGALHDYVRKQMPLFAPGSLSAEDNAKIVAYMLRANGYPAGPAPLPSDSAALAKIAFVPLTPAQLVKANSPSPLPARDE